MAWVWYRTPETTFLPAELDPKSPVQTHEALSDSPLPEGKGPAVYRSKSSLDNFRKLHCPPIGSNPVVDGKWQAIIANYVPANLVQFFPVRLIAGGQTSDEFSWVIPFSRVRCIDPERSDVTVRVEKPDITIVIDCNYYVHHSCCMNGLHLARDEQQLTHIVLSDELRDALAATGESSMFFKPEDLPTFAKRDIH